MVVGVCQLRMIIHGVTSLKEKRGVAKKIISRVHNVNVYTCIIVVLWPECPYCRNKNHFFFINCPILLSHFLPHAVWLIYNVFILFPAPFPL